jgi:polyphosphate kinase
MERNLDNRVEAVAPIHDPALQRRLQGILEVCLADSRDGWELQPDGSYVQRSPDGEKPVGAQETFMQQTRSSAREEF